MSLWIQNLVDIVATEYLAARCPYARASAFWNVKEEYLLVRHAIPSTREAYEIHWISRRNFVGSLRDSELLSGPARRALFITYII